MSTRLLAVLLSVLVFSVPVMAGAPGELTLTTERVVVFKDGHALFVKRATGMADPQGWVFTSQVPDAAVLGTFWAAAEGGRPLAMRGQWVETARQEEVQRPCASMADLLAANVGRTLTLEFSPDRGTRITGVVREVIGATIPDESPESSSRALVALRRDPQYVVVDEAAGGRLVLPVASVYRLHTREGEPPVATTIREVRTVTERTKRLGFDLGPQAGARAASITLMYFTPGVRWIPTYRLGDLKIDNGELSLQGEVLNEAEDIDGAVLDLVVGVPNFRFKDTVSPLVLESTLRNALAQAAPQLARQVLSNVAQVSFRERADEWRAAGDGAPPAPDQIVSSGEQDLFVYSLGAFTLARGARATVPLWTERTPLRHLYTLDVDVVRGAGGMGEGLGLRGEDSVSPLRRLSQRVWHQLELSNRSRRPWTTGAALLMQGLLPLGQELLTYTSPGGTTLLPVTVAIDVRAEYHEEELKREPNAMTWDRTQYALVTKRGTLSITNHRAEETRLRVRVSTGGLAADPSDQGTLVVDDFRKGDWGSGEFGRANNHSDVTWELTLQPGQKKDLSYTLRYYVR